jgi:hypothetical protein
LPKNARILIFIIQRTRLAILPSILPSLLIISDAIHKIRAKLTKFCQLRGR